MTTISSWRPKVRVAPVPATRPLEANTAPTPAITITRRAIIPQPDASRVRERNPVQGTQEAVNGAAAPTLAPPAPRGAQPMSPPRLVAPSLVAPTPGKRRKPGPMSNAEIEAIDAKAHAIVEARPPKPSKPTPAKVAGSSISLNAEKRAEWLKGQIANDCASLAHIANSVGQRIRAGETPRQDGEVGAMARQIDQNCASLYELLRLLRCYS